jgi:O-antigen ligase
LSFFLENKNASQKLTVGLILVMTICMFATSAYEQDDRVLILNDSWDRYDLWKSAISANTDVFFGVGTGDYKIVLNKYFHSHGMAEYEANNLNAHNQFIQIFLSNGILGLMSLIILLGRPLVISFRRRNTLGILVFFPFLLYGITEVFLGRYQGVVFFAFLHQVLMAHLDSTKPTLNLKHP